MRSLLPIAAAAFIGAALPATALPKPKPCDGFFNADVQGYTVGAGGALTPSGPPVKDGSTIHFKRMSRIAGKFYLFDAGSPRVFPGDDIALTTGCMLPEK